MKRAFLLELPNKSLSWEKLYSDIGEGAIKQNPQLKLTKYSIQLDLVMAVPGKNG